MPIYTYRVKMETKKMTTIRIDPEVRDQLGTIGKWGESQSDIVKRLIEFYKAKNK